MIEREPTPQERKDFEPLGEKDSAKHRFYKELAEKEQEAAKKKLPFASKAAVDDFNDEHEKQVKENIRKNGGYVVPSELKAIKMDWKKYSDLNNFELIDENEINDPELTKHNPGITVNIAKKTYKYKGYSNIYTVMESAPEAIARARKYQEELKEVVKKK